MSATQAMTQRITQQELESYLWGAAVLLRGLIDAGDYKQFIFPLLFYKRVADVWDEEYQVALAESGGDLSYAEFAENTVFRFRPTRTGKPCAKHPKMSAQPSRKPCVLLRRLTPTCLTASLATHLGPTVSAYPMPR